MIVINIIISIFVIVKIGEEIMCSIDVNVQKKVFENKSDSHNTRKEVIKRLHASGVVNSSGKLTAKYQFIARGQK